MLRRLRVGFVVVFLLVLELIGQTFDADEVSQSDDVLVGRCVPAPPVSNVSSSPPRIAVCITGGARTMRLAVPSLATNFIEALQPDAAYRHVFVNVGVSDDCGANYNNRVVLDECRAQHRKAIEWLRHPGTLETAFGACTNLHLDKKLTCNHPFLRNHSCCLKDKRTMNDGPGSMWGMAQYMRRRLCYDRIVQHERKTGVKFDLVAVTRPDMIFMEPVPPAEWFLSIQPRIFAMSKDNGWGDYVFIAPRSLSDKLHTSFNNMFSARCSKEKFGRGQTPEYRLEPHVGNQLPNQRFPLQGFIVRSPNRADCWRFENGVNDVGRYLNATGQLAPIHHICQQTYPYRTR